MEDKETSPTYWTQKAHETLRLSLQKLSLNTKPAKNVILFIGDGMDVTTMTAGGIPTNQDLITKILDFCRYQIK